MPMRISGLSTGFDTDTAVKEMMKAYRMPYNTLLKKKTTFEWQRDAYREMNTKITDFRNSKLFNYRLSTTFNANTATVTGDTSVLTATTTSASTEQNLQISVTTLAKSATKYSTADIRASNSFSATAKLNTQAANLTAGGFVASTYAIQVNGTTVNIDVNNDSLNGVLSRISSQTNVSAFFDSTTGKVSFNAKNSGLTNGATADQANITFTDDNNFLADVMGINVAADTEGVDSMAGTNASLVINGMATTRTSNSFEINGTKINLLKTSGATPSTVAVKKDIDGQVKTIKQFVSDYNEMLTTLQSKLKEPKYRTYQPLLDEEKEALKDTEITKYEEKAKSGMLRGDSILSLLETRMRTSVSTPVETGSTKYKTLSSIGIDTGASYTDNGKLRIKSESKLRAALAEEPDAVMAIFNQAGNGDSNTNDVGIVNRMYDQFQTSMDLIKKKAGVFGSLENSSSIGSQLITLGKEILRKNDYLNGLENKLYLQFSRMERAMSDFNAQSSYLSNNISAMNK